ncbi:hypothetical protein [uncultured Aquimarina sp.]|uniref:hypothetical protein n=1 Tax=uncultured Aquimarina sp. TaxID=575652 RepID=UPI00260DAA4D|nr:hypothetical protein [uncultured Aquimarina sp.]
MQDLKQGLTIPMYGLHYIDSIENVNYKQEDVILFKRDYSLEDRKKIFLSLEWAMKNPNIDFNNIKPYESDRFSNDEIYSYLEKLYIFMKENSLSVS